MAKKEKIIVFDTTLRDGEQVPGCQLNSKEKVEIAKDLEDLGVDVLEAGFPISSPGDFNSIVETEYFNYDGVILGHKKIPSYFIWKTTALRIIQDLPMDTPLVDYLEKNHVFLTKRSLSQPKTDPWDDIFS